MTAATGARSPFRLGLALAVLYAAIAVVSVRGAGTGRPLFDGFAPPPPYRWVNPPREFRAGNQPPRPSAVEVAMGPAGSLVASGSSEDGQIILSFGAGTFPARPGNPADTTGDRAGDVKVIVQITPVDPAVLPAPPAGLVADGNAYRLDFTADPSRAAVAELAMPADIFVVVPEPAQTLLFSPDGKVWENLAFRPVPDPTQIAGAFTRPGYFLAVAPPVGRPSEDGGGGEGAILTVGAVTLGLALALGLVPWGRRAVRGKGGAA